MHDQILDATTDEPSKPSGLNFARFLYNQNPFYLVSAALVLYGFSVSVTQDELTNSAWIFASLFYGYTVLLALSAWAIVKYGKVWDDARSILMVLLLLLLALSSGVDSFCIPMPSTAVILATVGFTFAVLLSEFLIRSLKIRFGALFRVPLYLMLGTSFFFPLVLTAHSLYFEETDVRSVVLVFPFLCAASLMTLIPAVRKGRQEIAENGTPWTWPLYPYSAFVLVAIGLCFRIAMVTWSFDHSPGFGMLGSWLYVPVLFAVAWILFEFGVIEKSLRLRKLALLFLPLAILFSMDWSTNNPGNFYHEVTAGIASPVWLTLVGVLVLFVVVGARGFREADKFTGAAMLLAAIVDTNGQFIGSVAELQAWPFVGLALFAIIYYCKVNLNVGCLLAASCVSVPVAKLATPMLAPWLGGGEGFTMACLIICLTMVAAFVISLLSSDRFAKQVRVVLAFAFPFVALMIAVPTIYESRPVYLPVALMVTFILASIALYRVAGSRLHLCSLLFSAGAVVVTLGSQSGVLSSLDNLPLLQFMAAGIGCLILGLLVSALKAGWSSAVVSGLEVLNWEIRDAFGIHEEPSALAS